VTNDDGIDSPGLAALAGMAVELGHETVVAAPSQEASGTGTSLMAAAANRRVIVESRDLPTLPGVPAYAVAAHPALIALIACHGAFGAEPDIVLSGVNRGPNVGRSVLHSGTVGAAVTAGVYGARAMAVSLDVGQRDVDPVDPHWAAATTLAADLLQSLADLAPGTILCVNAPNRPAADLPPARWARLATYGRVADRITRAEDGSIAVASLVVDGPLEPGTDAALLADGYPTVTPLVGISERPDLLDGRVGETVKADQLG
jgi:5'-nucleotidase